MNDSQVRVADFHMKSGLTVNLSPTIPSREDLYLRSKLLLEETLEFINAAGFDVEITPSGQIHVESSGDAPDLIEMADAIADIDYINMGNAVTLGIDAEKVSVEVHRSNMTKLFPDGTFHKNDYGKVIKPETYERPQIVRVLKEQGWKPAVMAAAQ